MCVPASTHRIRFGVWRPGDLPRATELWGDPRVMRFLDARGFLDGDAVRARLDAEIACAENHGFQYWPMTSVATGAFIGAAGLCPHRPDEGLVELGFHLCPAFWGQGLATEAGRAVIAHAFDTVGASAIFAGHHPQNQSSRHVLLKLGFRYTHHDLFPPTGLRHPGYLLRRPDPTAAE